MGFLKKNTALVGEELWAELEGRAKEVISSMTTTRRVLQVSGPKGLDYNAVKEGRLVSVKEGDIEVGTYRVKPLIEVRRSFSLPRTELDNFYRGAKDIELDNLEQAVREITLFEEEAVLNGYEAGNIQGLTAASEKTFELGKSGDEILRAISEAKYSLMDNYAEGPYDLVLSPEAYDRLNQIYEGAPLLPIVGKLLDGGVILRSKSVNGAIMIPHRHEDLELTIGQDFAIAYDSYDEENVNFFVTESFTFRILDESIIAAFTVK